MTTLLYIAANIIISILGIVAGYYHSAYKTKKKENDVLRKSIREFIHNQDESAHFNLILTKNSAENEYIKKLVEESIKTTTPDLMGTQSQTTISNESTEG